jgi:hypothetical protein
MKKNKLKRHSLSAIRVFVASFTVSFWLAMSLINPADNTTYKIALISTWLWLITAFVSAVLKFITELTNDN